MTRLGILVHVLQCELHDAQVVISAKLDVERTRRFRPRSGGSLLTHETPFWEMTPWIIPDGMFGRHRSELVQIGIRSFSGLQGAVEKLLRAASGYDSGLHDPDWISARSALSAFLAEYGEQIPVHTSSDLRSYARELKDAYGIAE